jgi:hypothetical protein
VPDMPQDSRSVGFPSQPSLHDLIPWCANPFGEPAVGANLSDG